MRERGLEWLFRLMQEPRLWRHYLVNGLEFVLNMTTESFIDAYVLKEET